MMETREDRLRKHHNEETIEHLREYLRVMADEPKDSLVLLRNVYHNIRRIIGDE